MPDPSEMRVHRTRCTDLCSFEAFANWPLYVYTELASNTEKKMLGRKKKIYIKNCTNCLLLYSVSSTVSYEHAVSNFQMYVLN